MKCPIYNCNFDIDKIYLEEILDKNYYQLLFGINKNEEAQKTIMDEEAKCQIVIYKNLLSKYKDRNKKFEFYQNKNVFEINPSLSLSSIKKYEEDYCPRCHEKSLFCLTSSYFNKCLNCRYKCCKYCNKEYTNIHLIMNDPRHCKVYYRKGKYFLNNCQNKSSNYFIQIIYIIGIYLIMISFLFLKVNNFFFGLLRIQNDKKKKSYLCINLVKYFFCFFLCFLIYLIILLFMELSIPFFPVIILLLDGF